MIEIHHINAGWLRTSVHPEITCHCLILQEGDQVALVDVGIGVKDAEDPVGRLGQQLIDLAGFTFDADETAFRKLEQRGIDPHCLGHIILTHADPDHAGGLADFPQAMVHVSQEELDNVNSGHWRYVTANFAHQPKWVPRAINDAEFFGLPARRLPLGFSQDILLVPLFGHTKGHCGVAIPQGDRWFLHVGDAYYLKAELTDLNHTVDQLAEMRADDNEARLESLDHLRRIAREHADVVTMCGYHDVTEWRAFTK